MIKEALFASTLLVSPGNNSLPSEQHACIPFTDCMPVEACIEFVYKLDMDPMEGDHLIEMLCLDEYPDENEEN